MLKKKIKRIINFMRHMPYTLWLQEPVVSASRFLVQSTMAYYLPVLHHLYSSLDTPLRNLLNIELSGGALGSLVRRFATR